MTDDGDSRTFVKDLFKLILGRTEVGQKELDYWADRAASGIISDRKLFYEFASSKEGLARMLREQTSTTMFPSGHFYSPVVNTTELLDDLQRVYSDRSLSSVDLNAEVQIDTFEAISKFFEFLPFTDEKSDRFRYRYDNTSYGFGDACIYWGIIGHFRPQHIVEVGSGFTSALVLDAIESFRLSTSCTFIDPYPALALALLGTIDPKHLVIESRVQDIDLNLISRLGTNDILFIDSSHIVKTGSDVHFELTEMLPRLNSGTIIHFHDVFYPFEYPQKWTLNDNKSWNELYYLHTFLMYNGAFEIIYFNDYFAKIQRPTMASLPIRTVDRILLNPGGGLWLRKL